MAIKATLIPGDGVGPEIVKSLFSILDSMGSPFDFDIQHAGLGAFEKTGSALPPETIASIRANGVALKGPLATPSGGGYRSATVQMREEFQLFASIRPAKSFIPGKPENVDLVIVRENLQGLYASVEGYIAVGDDPHAVAFATCYNTMEAMVRIIRHAVDLAIKEDRHKVTVVHKSNILKMLSGIILEAADRVRPDAQGIEIDHMIADAFGAKLFSKTQRFDVVVTTNLFGDLFSDIAAELIGGLGVAPSVNYGKDCAIFEAVHGTADDIAGKGIVNPSSLLLSAAMMLEHVGLPSMAIRLDDAVRNTIRAGEKTRDLEGSLNTEQFTDAVISRLCP